MGEETPASVPWFRDPSSPHPFTLQRIIPPDPNDRRPLLTVAIFPWNTRSLEKLWGGQFYTEGRSAWEAMILEWRGTIAVGGEGRLIIRSLLYRQSKNAIIHLPDASTCPSFKDREILGVGWVLRKSAPCDPLIVFTASKTVFILDPKSLKLVGRLRGHGGGAQLIRSAAVHPTFPNLFCTTSQDFTTRIYDIDLTPKLRPNNPPWPPDTLPSRAGPAHGLDMNGPEGEGIGQCVAVLVGEMSGGHRCDVLAAAFHPEKDIIATCGMDCTVKIWRIPWLENGVLHHSDKPLFTSTLIHKSRVLSISWTAKDMLMSHSAPSLKDPANWDWDPGTIVHWHWLGFERHFPTSTNAQGLSVGRCISDYQESSSFMITAIMKVPIIHTQTHHITHSPHFHLYCDEVHDPLVLMSSPKTNTIGIINATNLPLHKAPIFPLDFDLLYQVNQLQLDGNNSKSTILGGNEKEISPYAEDWVIDAGYSTDESIEASAMGLDGMLIVSVGSQGGIWVWLATGLQGR